MFLDAGCQLNLDVSQSGDNILHYLVNHARTRKVEPMLQAIMNAVSKTLAFFKKMAFIVLWLDN